MQCELEKITVHYETYGAGRPILMLHGWPSDHQVMVDVMESHFERRDGWLRLYPDLPGMGQTPGPEWLTHQDQVLDVVLDFIDAVIPGQRFVVAGLSYGGLLARGVVYRRAAWMDGLLLTVPVVCTDLAARHLPPKTTLVTDSAYVAQLQAAGAEGFIEMAVVQGPKLLRLVQDLLPAVQSANHAFLERLRQGYAFSFDVDKLTEPFLSPTLILTGRQDHWWGYQDTWTILEIYPRATFAVLDRAGHAVWVEQEDLVIALTREWLDRVEEWCRVPPEERVSHAAPPT
jgi:pimeloyl-ACP methyl ester carboxylesterase